MSYGTTEVQKPFRSQLLLSGLYTSWMEMVRDRHRMFIKQIKSVEELLHSKC